MVRANPNIQGAFEGHSKLHDDCCCASTVFLVDDDATERMRTRRELERMVTNIFVVVDDGVTDGVADGWTLMRKLTRLMILMMLR